MLVEMYVGVWVLTVQVVAEVPNTKFIFLNY